MPKDDVQVEIAIPKGGSAAEGEEIVWTTTQTGPINVYAQLMDGKAPWFTPSPCNFTGPASGPLADGSNIVTAAANSISPPTGWTYTSNVLQGQGHVVVTAPFPHRDRKAG